MNITFPAALAADYGEPLGHCVEASAAGTAGNFSSSAVFQRRWSKATVELDCMEWTSKIEMKTDDAAAMGFRLLAVVSGAVLAPAPAAALENQLQGQCVTAANTDLSRPGQGPDLTGCASVAACCAHCAGKAPFFVFQETGACYCKSPPFERNPALHNTAGSCSDLPLPPCTSLACREAARRPGPAQV